MLWILFVGLDMFVFVVFMVFVCLVRGLGLR